MTRFYVFDAYPTGQQQYKGFKLTDGMVSHEEVAAMNPARQRRLVELWFKEHHQLASAVDDEGVAEWLGLGGLPDNRRKVSVITVLMNAFFGVVEADLIFEVARKLAREGIWLGELRFDFTGGGHTFVDRDSDIPETLPPAERGRRVVAKRAAEAERAADMFERHVLTTNLGDNRPVDEDYASNQPITRQEFVEMQATIRAIEEAVKKPLPDADALMEDAVKLTPIVGKLEGWLATHGDAAVSKFTEGFSSALGKSAAAVLSLYVAYMSSALSHLIWAAHHLASYLARTIGI